MVAYGRYPIGGFKDSKCLSSFSSIPGMIIPIDAS